MLKLFLLLSCKAFMSLWLLRSCRRTIRGAGPAATWRRWRAPDLADRRAGAVQRAGLGRRRLPRRARENVRQAALRPLWARWGGEASGRERVMPHIKSYCRYTCAA